MVFFGNGVAGIVGGKAHHHAVIHVAPLGVVVAFCDKWCGSLHKRHGILKRGENIGPVQVIFVQIPEGYVVFHNLHAR